MKTSVFCFGIVSFAIGFNASAATVPFVEDFTSDASDWHDASGAALLDWVASGGPDGSSHAQTTFSLMTANEGDTPLIFRAQDKWNSSGGAFNGNWIADGVHEFRAFVRHDAPFPLTFFVRFSGPGNFPGAVAIQFAPVFPNTWTEIVIPIDAGNPQFISFEGTDFPTVFSNIGHVQVGISVGADQGGFPQPITFDIDKPGLTECVPDCAGVECGDDGCGGSCGDCGEGESCLADGTCAAASVPTVSSWGLVVLALLLLTAGKVARTRLHGIGAA